MTAPQDPYAQQPGGSYPSPGGQPYGAGAPTGHPYGAGVPGGQPYGGGAPGDPAAYGGGYGAPPAQHRGTNGLAVAALVLGVLALLSSLFVVGGLLGILAIGLGIMGRTRARRGAGGGGMALTGIVLGVISALIATALVVAGVSLYNSDEGQQLRECLEQAQGDQTAIDRCSTELGQ